MSPTRPLTAAIYARVSTEDQNYNLQFAELREYVARMGWTAVEYAEKESSVKRRPVLNKLMEDARGRKVDVVVVWKLDRFARSLQQLIENVQALDSAGVRFIAVTQAIDTDRRNPTSKLLLHIMAAFAEFEREIIVERVKAGVKEYRSALAAGKIGTERHSRSGRDLAPGRPKRIFRRDKALELRAQGRSLRDVARELRVPLSTLVDGLKDAAKCTENLPAKPRKKG